MISTHSKREGTIQLILFIHILFVTFLIPIRAIFIDSPYVRDIMLFILILYVFVTSTANYRFDMKLRISMLDKFVAAYLLYGMFLTILWINGGVNLHNAILTFRNNLFPFVLYFIARKSFNNSASRVKLTNLFIFIFLIILIDILIEYIFIRILGFSNTIFPWYTYTFDNSYYFYGGNLAYYGSAVAHPETSPILGIFGWPHFTSAAFFGLFAFSYPFIMEKKRKLLLIESSLWINNFSSLFCSLIVFFTAVIILFILRVKMQMIILLIILIILPFLTKKIYLSKGLLILTILVVILFSSDTVYELLRESYKVAFVSLEGGRSSLYYLTSINPFYSIFSQPILKMLFGRWDYSGGSELRLLNYTLQFGLIWLFLFVGIFTISFIDAQKLLRSYFTKSFERLFAIGIICLLIAHFIDMGHYARVMIAPNIDILAVCLGTLSGIKIKTKYFSIYHSERSPQSLDIN